MNQYQQSERQSYSAAVSLIIVLVIAVAVGLYLYKQNDPNYNTAKNGIHSNPRAAKELQKK
jgi:hypothetical protein